MNNCEHCRAASATYHENLAKEVVGLSIYHDMAEVDAACAPAAFPPNSVLFAVAKSPEGTIDLTVYEQGQACTAPLSAEMAIYLAGLLTHPHDQGQSRS